MRVTGWPRGGAGGNPPVPFAQRKGRQSAANAGDGQRSNNPQQKETPPRGDVGPAIRSLGRLITMIYQTSLRVQFHAALSTL